MFDGSIIKAVASFVLLDVEKAEQVYQDCLKWIPKEYMPDFCYTDDIALYYREGMYQKGVL